MATMNATPAKILALCCILQQSTTQFFLTSAFSYPSSLSLPFLRTIKHVSSSPTVLAVSLTPPSEKRDNSKKEEEEDEQQQQQQGDLEKQELIDMISSLPAPSQPPQKTKQPPQTTKTTELWLDLRKTAIVPTPLSLSHLFSENEVQRKEMEKYNVDYMLYQIDSILVSSEMDVARIRNVLHKHQESEEEENEEGEEKVNWEEFRNAILEKVIWETEDGSIVRISSPPTSSKQNMEVVGKVMPPPTNDNPSVLLLDPILAMDTITSNKWVLVDTTSSNTKNSETERYESITSLVEFMGGILSSNPSSPLLLHTTPTTHDDTTNHEKGGIALSCTTKQDIFQAGVSIQSLLCSQSSSAVQMTESGILLPHIMEREEAEFEEDVVDSTMIQRDGDDGGGVGGGGVIRSAVVLPFDAMLWKSALIVFGDDEGYDDENDVGDLI